MSHHGGDSDEHGTGVDRLAPYGARRDGGSRRHRHCRTDPDAAAAAVIHCGDLISRSFGVPRGCPVPVPSAVVPARPQAEDARWSVRGVEQQDRQWRGASRGPTAAGWEEQRGAASDRERRGAEPGDGGCEISVW